MPRKTLNCHFFSTASFRFCYLGRLLLFTMTHLIFTGHFMCWQALQEDKNRTRNSVLLDPIHNVTYPCHTFVYSAVEQTHDKEWNYSQQNLHPLICHNGGNLVYSESDPRCCKWLPLVNPTAAISIISVLTSITICYGIHLTQEKNHKPGIGQFTRLVWKLTLPWLAFNMNLYNLLWAGNWENLYKCSESR